MAPLDSQRFLVVGGQCYGEFLKTTEVLDLDEMQFQPGPNMQSKRTGCLVTLVGAEQILVVGGYDGGYKSKTTEILAVEEEATRRRRR